MDFYHILSFEEPNTSDESLMDSFYNGYCIFTKEIYPDDPLMSKERFTKSIKELHPDLNIHRWLVQEKESKTVIGRGLLFISKENHPVYETNKHIANGDILLVKEHQRKGIGTHLLSILMEKARECERSLFQTWSNQESGYRFCEKLDGKVALEAFETRLKMSDVDWKMIKDWVDEGPVKADGVSLERFNDVPDKNLEEYCNVYTETLNQVPLGEFEGREKVTPEFRRIREERIKKRNGIWTTLVSKEENEVISGLTEVVYYLDTPSIIHQDLTSVKEEYRGRNLGKWLKAEMLLWIKENYPEVKTITTENATTNAPMLSINNRLGFKEYKSGKIYKFDVQELIAKIKAIIV